MAQAEMDPNAFEKLCIDAGAENLYHCINNAICSERMSHECKHLSSIRTMVIIYIMMYSQSQKSNLFQVSLSRILQQFGISNEGIEPLRNLGIAAYPETIRVLTKSSAFSHPDHVLAFIESAIENNHFMIFLTDNYHNIHTKHRPEDKTQTQAIHMTTLLLKVFPEVAIAISNHGADILPKNPVEISNVEGLITCSMSKLSKTYAEIMPDWVVAKYFDREAERHRLL